ncbi:MAG: hypothetical protein ACLGH8_09240 [Bacteroidia bacterium]
MSKSFLCLLFISLGGIALGAGGKKKVCKKRCEHTKNSHYVYYYDPNPSTPGCERLGEGQTANLAHYTTINGKTLADSFDLNQESYTLPC